MTMEHDAYRYAIRNAYDHHGKADIAAVIGKIKALYPDENVKEMVPIAKKTVEKVNRMGLTEIREEYQKFEAEGFELKIPDKKVGLLDLEWTTNEPVITRWAPNPNAPAHLGNMRPAILSYLYAKKYNGEFILRFEDTDPKIKKPMQGVEELFLHDLEWVHCPPDKIVRQSDRLEIYYDYMHQLIEMGNAYVCTCEREKWKKNTLNKKPCPCRSLEPTEQKKRLEKMFQHEYKEGKAVLRIKTDMNAEDPAERDWWAAKIVDKPQHYKIKDKFVWPGYNFAAAIDDHLMGVTLIIRGQQHTSNVKKQKWLYRHFGWTYPHTFHHGKLSLEGAELSKSKMIEGIASGKYSGWDDPRLFTVQSLGRKGFNPHAFVDMMVDLGVKTSDTRLSIDILANYNRKYVENSPMIPFILNPIQLDVDFVPELMIEMDGEKKELKSGTQAFYVSKEDTKKWRIGSTLRLRNAYIVKINSMDEWKINAQFVSIARLENTTQTNWLTHGVSVAITQPDSSIDYGMAGEKINELGVGTEIQFSNYGYCRIDEKKENETKLWFTHE
ncbi:MAG: glutamate--tRNA ligase [Candidatus Diapherotrites archaeon]